MGVLAGRGVAGAGTDRIGARWISFAGLTVTALATVPFALASAHTNAWWLVGALVVRGLGLGAVTIPVMSAAYLGLRRTEIPDASIITRTAQQLGGSFGTAVLAVVLERALAAHDRAAAFDRAFWWSIGFTAAAIALTMWLPARGSPGSVGFVVGSDGDVDRGGRGGGREDGGPEGPQA